MPRFVKGRRARVPSLNKQTEVMFQLPHHLEFPELRVLGGEREESWSGLVWGQFKQAASLSTSGGFTCSSVSAKGMRGFRHPPQKWVWG